MKHVFVLLLLSLSVGRCFGQSQTAMNMQADADYRKADKELNLTYQKILKEYQPKTAFIQNLKAAQKLWIQFRDAEVKAKYPDADQEYGSVFPTCWSQEMAALTRERTRHLKVWLVGIPEGDVCAGSVKTAAGK